MGKVKKRIFVGVIFAVSASLLSVLVKSNGNFLEIVKLNAINISIFFVVYFLVGYFLLGNLVVNKKR